MTCQITSPITLILSPRRQVGATETGVLQACLHAGIQILNLQKESKLPPPPKSGLQVRTVGANETWLSLTWRLWCSVCGSGMQVLEGFRLSFQGMYLKQEFASESLTSTFYFCICLPCLILPRVTEKPVNCQAQFLIFLKKICCLSAKHISGWLIQGCPYFGVRCRVSEPPLPVGVHISLCILFSWLQFVWVL